MDGDRNISEIISDIRDNCELAKAAIRMVLATAVRMLPKQPTATAMLLLPQQAALPIPQHRQTATLPMVAATTLLTATVLLMATAKSLPLMQQ